MADTDVKRHRARWALINSCIERGVFDGEEAFRDFLENTFGTRRTSQLSPFQQKIMWLYLKHFLGEGPKPTYREDWRITSAQKHRIQTICDNWRITPAALNGFIKRQTGAPKLVEALTKKEASKVITGLEKMYPNT